METFNQVIELLKTVVSGAGALLIVWGVVIVGSNLKDHNGPMITNGIWQIVGGVLIVLASQLLLPTLMG